MKNQLVLPLSALLVLSQLAGCGGSGSSSSTTQPPVTTTPPPSSPIPDTQAVASIDAPDNGVATEQPAIVNEAVLRHVHRNTVDGILSPDGDYIDSPNGKVERLTGIGLYVEVEPQADNTYAIEPRANGLSYFKVTNTKPNGSVRVHNFHGVPVGHYMTFDTTNVDDVDDYDSQCRDVAIRMTNLPQQVSQDARLLVNGSPVTDAVYDQSRGYVANTTLCPIDAAQNYLAVVAFEDQPENISYGFNFYHALQDGNLLEIDVTHQAENIAWSADHAIDESFFLHGMNPHWTVQVGLYTSAGQQTQSGFYPHFAELALDSYRMSSQVIDSQSGISIFNREFATGLSQVHFANNNIILDDIELNPLNLQWQDIGADSPKVVSGVLFDTELTQSYAFMSMDPDVLADRQLNFPLDDIELVADAGLIGLTGGSGINEDNLHYVGNSALHNGFLYWPNGPTASQTYNNADLFITANISVLLEMLLELKTDE